MNNCYLISFFKDSPHEEQKSEYVYAESKKEAYLQFMDNHCWLIFAAWVDHIQYKNGRIHYFNTFCGKPY